MSLCGCVRRTMVSAVQYHDVDRLTMVDCTATEADHAQLQRQVMHSYRC